MLNKLKTFDKQKLITVSATFFVAWATGFAMQNSDRIAETFGVTSATSVHDVRLASADVSDKQISGQASVRMMPSAPRAALGEVSSAIDLTVIPDHVRDMTVDATPPVNTRHYSPFGMECKVGVTAVPGPAAMVNLEVNAPCHNQENVEISHNGLAFTAQTSVFGVTRVKIPALAQNAVFQIRFADGSIATAKATVPDFASYDRAIIQWQGKAELRIHALEFGAGYSDAGHVWAKAPRSAAYGLQARGGFITELGDTRIAYGKRAEVYSFPTRGVDKSGTVRLMVEAAVNANTCNRNIDAQVLQIGSNGAVKSEDLTVTMPDCNAIGEFLVLKNVLQDLKIARN